MTYRAALFAAFAVLAVDAVSLAFGIYKQFPNIDIPLHLAGGFAMAMLAIAVHDDFKRRHKIGRTPGWYDLLFTLGFVSLVAIGWEFHEFVLDRTIVVDYQLAVSQLSVADTIGDFLNGLIGATTGWLVFGRRPTPHYGRR